MDTITLVLLIFVFTVFAIVVIFLANAIFKIL